MLIIAIIIGLGIGSLLFRRRAMLEGNTAVIEPATRTVKATVDGKPVHSYIADD
jgi:hypothetical protein